MSQVGTRTFFVNAKLRGSGKNKAITLGHFPQLLPEEARNRAIEELRGLQLGIDPQETQKAQNKEEDNRRRANVTVKEAVEEFMRAREGKHCGQTEYTYRCLFKAFSSCRRGLTYR